MFKPIMQAFQFKFISWRTRAVCAAFALVASLATLSAVFVVFASASGELGPLEAKIKAEPAASAVASKALVKRVRS